MSSIGERRGKKAVSVDRKVFFSTFSLFFFPIALALAVGFIIYYKVDVWHEERALKSTESIQVRLSLNSIARDFQAMVPDLEVLASSTPLHEFVNTGKAAAREKLENELVIFARQRRIYDQIRYLDATGREIVRINYKGGRVEVVPPERLQDKSGRYYFRESVRLRPGEVYVSPMDLNVEHGEIEKPFKPVMRVATPVAGRQGGVSGVFILNYLAGELLKHFEESLISTKGHMALLNSDGYWLYSHEKDREWGFMLDSQWRYEKMHSRTWERIHDSQGGQFLNDDGLFTFATVDPMAEAHRAAFASGENLPSERSGRQDDGYRWKVVSHVGRKTLAGLTREHIVHYLGLYLMLVGGIGLVAWHIARGTVEKRQLLNRLQLHAKVMEIAAEGIVITDADRKIIATNPSFTAITGYEGDEVLGKDPGVLASGRHDDAFYQGVWQEIREKDRWQGEVWDRRRGGDIYPEWLTISIVRDDTGKPVNYIGIFTDITGRKLAEARLKRLASYDALTGLPNRNLFYDRAEQALVQAHRHGVKVALIYIDLDRFKPINDALGHHVGDQVLQQVAGRLKACVRESDTVARVGGDEFVVISQDITDRESAALLAKKIIHAFEDEFVAEGHVCTLGASIGISVYPDDDTEVDGLLRKADAAMYRVKHADRNAYRFFADG